MSQAELTELFKRLIDYVGKNGYLAWGLFLALLPDRSTSVARVREVERIPGPQEE